MSRDPCILKVTGRGLSLDLFQIEEIEDVVNEFILSNSHAKRDHEVDQIYQYTFVTYRFGSYSSARRMLKLVVEEFPSLKDRISTFDIDSV